MSTILQSNRIFALRPSDPGIPHLLLDPTVQAVTLSSGRILYLAHPLPLSTLTHLTTVELQSFYQYLDGTRVLINNFCGEEAAQYNAGIQSRILEKLRECGLSAPQPTRLVAGLRDVMALEPGLHKQLQDWMAGGLDMPAPIPHVDEPRQPPPYVDVGNGPVLRRFNTEDPTFDLYWRSVAALDKKDRERLARGRSDDFECSGDETRSSHSDISSDYSDYSCEHCCCGSSSTCEEDIKKGDNRLASAHIRPAKNYIGGLGSSDTLYGDGRKLIENETGDGYVEGTPAEWILSRSKWPSHPIKFLAFLKTVHPGELGLLATGELHIVNDNSEQGFRLAAHNEPTEPVLTREEWYMIFSDYKNDAEIESEQEFKAALDNSKYEMLPQKFYVLLKKGKGIRRMSKYDEIKRKIRKIRDTPLDVNMTGQQWRKRFFAKDSQNVFSK
ncbi:hypothetical protein DM02DRAFT_187541 [Periconia macrospinosa]|uniref:Uncharacterized protein n=1 Tax=Periconia macrospinosa TaxID=97972 RepID=A0A2V1E1C0_9PLEO|nr:hypothetical protein DM02DRAFT_187541 [Periconia macrospinosa]